MSFQPHSIRHVRKLEQGRHGITGLVTCEGKMYVYKLSQFMNHLPIHEFIIAQGLDDITESCPHFCRAVALHTIPIHPNFRDKEQNPFERSKHSIGMDVLFLEYIKDSISFFDLIQNPQVPIHAIMSIVKQVVVAISIAQEKKRFAHYDLHAVNILIQTCDPSTVHVYKLDDDNVISIPTFGYIPIIIDYNFSRSDDILDKPSYVSLAYTDSGYMAPLYDPIADLKVFLISVRHDLNEWRSDCKLVHTFDAVVYNLFRELCLDWTTGWDQREDDTSIIDYVSRYVQSANKSSDLFRQYSHICMDIFQSLIILPYRSQLTGSMRKLLVAYEAFVGEFSKIEHELNNPFYALYIFRFIVDKARDVRDAYGCTSTRQQTIVHVRREVFNRIHTLMKYVTLKDVDFDIVLCALYSLAEQLEYQLQRMLSSYIESKNIEYQGLRIANARHVYALLDLTIPHPVEFNTDAIIVFLDSTDNTQSVLELSGKVCDKLNSFPVYSRGMILDKFVTQK